MSASETRYIDNGDLRRAPEPDDVECSESGDLAVTAIKFYNLTSEYTEEYGFCDDHEPHDQNELDTVTNAIRGRRDPHAIDPGDHQPDDAS